MQPLDYLKQHYAAHGVRLLERAGITYPVARIDSPPEQTDIDTLLAGEPPRTPLARDAYAAYNDGHVAALQAEGRTVYNGAMFALDRLETEPQMRVYTVLGTYFDFVATCQALGQEMEAQNEFSAATLSMRTALDAVVDPAAQLLDGRGRSAALGVSVLLVYNDAGTYRALLARRSMRAAVAPGAFHVLPAFMFEATGPDYDLREWDVRHQVYREYLEEVFGMTEAEEGAAFDEVYEHPALRDLLAMLDDGRAILQPTGAAMNVFTVEHNLTTLLLIKDPAWRARSDFGETWETAQGGRVAVPIANDDELLAGLPPNHTFAPHGAAGLWMGVDRARYLLERTS